MKSVHNSTAALLIVCSQFPGKSVNVSSITITGMRRLHVAVVT